MTLALFALLYTVAIIFWVFPEMDKREAEWQASPKNPINICLKKGGVPSTSAWDGELTDCDFKKEASHES